MKLTRQGVPDLNTHGVNGHRTRKCQHFYGSLQVVDYEWADIEDIPSSFHRREVYGRRCLHCGTLSTPEKLP